MAYKRNTKLITKVFTVGMVIAALSYLFHPEIGQISVILNGQPITDSLVRFAAVPTFLVMLGLTVFITIMLFVGIGMFMFLGVLFAALTACFLIAPYLWPILAIIFLVIAVMSFSHEDKS
jgi:hypothetical protein